MRLAISNIAWDIAEDSSVAKLLGKFGVDAIDVAPGKYFPEPANASDEDITKVRRWWADHGIEIIGMQALLFGTTGLNVFGERKSQEAMLEHLRAVCRIGSGLGATRLVFGSPKNRDCSGLSDAQALEQAVSFFRRLGNVAQEHGVIVCLEPNPTRYGANFMTNSDETAHVVAAVGHVAIRMQFDTGALTINGESPEDVLDSSAGLIGHVHAGEPDLVPLGDGGTDHRLMHTVLQQHLPHHVVSIEMVATKEEPHLQSIERALVCAVEYYRTKHEVAR
ncbi:sugar phosphate isomerase/epimerase [Laribacter hongkongensis]|uniref:sugar phosphate isomerase/epimerase family protein n=1 Tax=Laribacter hongkongensis TaxID=168471 RepID=UPI001EFDF7C6|nr:sugar phosphate isomerase/epimerase family protein [Laribacter hongkongensis]MCG8993366.1 sugar phosphate isomerase/epimerase [Laribacter hongkongensis]MCG8999207.1 sugar phosphate isomerase/epimerase [Laribacter hongkongensis]MCG9002367.1 sugar phosphate isomerase/epimerase [Laribacter hongkongensis]MCG9005495.1 sugar phosphate isomerase/epimerase [Laribacter hongkongensis]MCG9007980.1 sugar phosphate isomerase/epimerase [Laribacter hongkongensis]